MRDRCPHEQCGVGAGETWDWQSADLVERHRGIVVGGRVLDAGFFVVDLEMPRRIGINNGIASVAWEWLVTGRGQPFDTFGATHFSLTRSDLLCRPKDLPLAPCDDLLLLLNRERCHVCSRRDRNRALLDGVDKFGRSMLLNFTGVAD